MITEDYVSFEVAQLLKEKGFDVPCTAHWFIGTDRTFNISNYPQNWNAKKTDLDWVSCPTQAMTMKWLREVHNIHISTTYDYREETWNCDVEQSLVAHIEELVGYKTYEQAIEAAIMYCLKNLI